MTDLYDAIYENRTIFQWITLTKHGVIPGRLSRDYTKSELEKHRPYQYLKEKK